MLANDPLSLTVSHDVGSDVDLDVDVLDPFGNRCPQQHQSSFLATCPLATVALAPASDDDR